jgi:Fur family ferric uptake transcriptional regulator
MDCGRVEEFFDAEIEKRQRTIAQSRGFELQEHALALYATCTKKACPHKAKQ